MGLADVQVPPQNPYLRVQDPLEATLEAQEAHKYLLAKSYFDTREYDRCAAVFLPPTIPPVPLSTTSPNTKSKQPLTPQKGKARASAFGDTARKSPYPRLSQKSLFLALYAKYLSGEKRKDEETEMVLGPSDGGMTANRELPDLARGLEGWLAERSEKGLRDRSQGWLEYLYGVILMKGRNEEEAKKWLIRSVHLNPFHWGAWQELNDLLASTEDVSGSPMSIGCTRLIVWAVETSCRSPPAEYHDPHIPCLLQPGAVPSHRRHLPGSIRTRKYLSIQRIPEDTAGASFLPFKMYVAWEVSSEVYLAEISLQISKRRHTSLPKS